VLRPWFHYFYLRLLQGNLLAKATDGGLVPAMALPLGMPIWDPSKGAPQSAREDRSTRSGTGVALRFVRKPEVGIRIGPVSMSDPRHFLAGPRRSPGSILPTVTTTSTESIA